MRFKTRFILKNSTFSFQFDKESESVSDEIKSIFRRKAEEEMEDKFDAVQNESELKHKQYQVSVVA